MIPIDGSPIVREGRVVILAYDHGLEHGPKDFAGVPGSADPERVFEVASHPAVTALAVQKGVAEAYFPSYEDRVNLLLKLNGTTSLWMGEPYSPQNCSVAYAAELGASAVGYTVYGGSNHETRMFQDFRGIQEEARAHELPVVMWSYPRGQGVQSDTTNEVLGYASRLALELGADVAKIKYNGNPDAMRLAVEMAGRMKVVMSGGSKRGDLAFLQDVQDVMAAGASGLAVGRNVFQREDPVAFLDALEAVIYKGASAEDAQARLG